MQKTSQDILDSIVEAYLSGRTQKEAAEMFGKSSALCGNELRKRGIPTRTISEAKAGKALIPHERRNAAALAYQSGRSLADVAAGFGHTKATCKRIIKSLGVEVRPLGTPLDKKDAMVAAYLTGKSAAQAAALFGLDAGVCSRELARRGIVPRKNGEHLRGKVAHNRTPQAVLDAIVEAYLKGATAKAACAPYGKDSTVCLDELKRRGLKARSVPPPRVSRLEDLTGRTFEHLTVIRRAPQTGGQVRWVCSCSCGCNSEVMVQAGNLKSGHSTACKRKKHGKRPASVGIKISAAKQGIPVSQWAGHSSPKWALVKASDEWKEWRAEVFRRDNYKCADCGKRGRGLQPHHIFRKAKYPQLTFEVSNGITLCKDCHAAIKAKEEQHAPRYLAKIGSTVAPLPLFDKWPDKPTAGRQRKAKQLNLF